MGTFFKTMQLQEFPIMAQWKQIRLGTMTLWAHPWPHSVGYEIWHYRELWCRSQTWLRSHVAVAVV